VIPAAEFSVIQEADQYHAQAKLAWESTTARSNAAHQEAWNAAHVQGQENGRDMALRSLSMMITDIRAGYMAREGELGQVVLAAVEHILGEMPPEKLIQKVIRRALRDMADQTSVRLLVSPEAHGRVMAALASELAPSGDATPVISEVRSDPVLEPGEMIIETNHGRYNVGLKSQMQRLADGLRQGTGAA
jgi:type III secretion system HrpE/YscL family protein